MFRAFLSLVMLTGAWSLCLPDPGMSAAQVIDGISSEHLRVRMPSERETLGRDTIADLEICYGFMNRATGQSLPRRIFIHVRWDASDIRCDYQRATIHLGMNARAAAANPRKFLMHHAAREMARMGLLELSQGAEREDTEFLFEGMVKILVHEYEHSSRNLESAWTLSRLLDEMNLLGLASQRSWTAFSGGRRCLRSAAPGITFLTTFRELHGRDRPLKLFQSLRTTGLNQSLTAAFKAPVSELEDIWLKKVRELSGDKVPSQHDLDAAQAALQRARAAESTAKAQVSEAQATLEAKETDLRKTVIYSPINGIVLTRDVDPGQTVAASFQAPVLFTLAEDLTQMELHVDVDEADVGRVREEQEAIFTVDAYQDRRFPARVRQVRYGSETVNGVVTYKTVLNVDNSDLSLRPGMTATADITVEKIENAILVPNAALRFAPPVTEKETPSDPRSLLSKLLPGRPGRPARQGKDGSAGNKQQRVWTLQDGKLVPIAVTTGASDGTMTEVTGSDIAAGLGLVVDTVKSGS